MGVKQSDSVLLKMLGRTSLKRYDLFIDGAPNWSDERVFMKSTRPAHITKNVVFFAALQVNQKSEFELYVADGLPVEKSSAVEQGDLVKLENSYKVFFVRLKRLLVLNIFLKREK
jgi:hypothetical protein